MGVPGTNCSRKIFEIIVGPKISKVTGRDKLPKKFFWNFSLEF
jgi:hypothetical protein